MNIRYLLNSGKNSKLKYYALEYLHYYLPACLFRRQRKRLIESLDKRKDKEYILSRVNYYNKTAGHVPLPDEAMCIADQTLSNHKSSKVYFFDSNHYLKYFPATQKFILRSGDITHIPNAPALVKSRPICGDNSNSIVLNMDKVRHFLFINDKIQFKDKKDMILFRGEIDGKPRRIRFMEMYFNHPMCDLADVSPHGKGIAAYHGEKMTINQHLDYKFIMALEGNDVASNLKWVMSSNSIAVMPRPRYETWFMEGTLRPDYHYIEIRPDYTDLIEKCTYYAAHPEEAEQIIAHAHEYVEQFKDKKREKLISLLVLDKYFKHLDN